jgi:hypothetical protein
MNEQENEQSQLAKPTTRNRISSERWEQIKTAHASGIGLREIARNMFLPAGTVLAREIQSAKALARREDASPAVTPVQAVAASMQQRGERHIGGMASITERGVEHVEAMDGGGILDRIDEVEKLDKVARRTFRLDETGHGGGNNVMVNVALLDIAPETVRVAEIEPSGD